MKNKHLDLALAEIAKSLPSVDGKEINVDVLEELFEAAVLNSREFGSDVQQSSG